MPEKVIGTIERVDNAEAKLTLTQPQKDYVVKTLKMLISTAETDMSSKKKQWTQADKDYKGKLTPRTIGWSNICVPLVKTKLRKLTRKLKGQVVRNRPIFPLEPQEQSDVERVEKAERFLDSEAKKEMKIEVPTEDVINDVGKYGTGFMKVVYVDERESNTGSQTFDGTNLEDVKLFNKRYPNAFQTNPDILPKLFAGETVEFNGAWDDIIYQGPRPTRVKRANVVTPKGYVDITKMPFYFEKMKMSWYELEDGERDGKYESAGLEKIRKKYSTQKDPQKYLKKQYDVYEGMWKYRANDKTTIREKCLFTLIPDENVYLRGLKYKKVFNHGRPYLIPFRIIRNADDFDGDAIAADLSDMQKLLNMIFNITIDADAMNYPMFKAKKNAGYNFDIEKIYPFKVWWVDNKDDLEQMNTGSNRVVSSLKIMELGQRFSDDLSSISELMSGRESSLDPNAPAQKTDTLLEQSEEGISEYLKTFLLSWNEMIYQICELYSQHGTKGKEYRVLNEDTGEPSLEAAPDDLRVRPDMEPHGGEVMFSKAGRKATLLQLMQTLQADPIVMQYIQQYPQAWMKLWERVIQNWGAGLGKLAHQILPPEQVIREEQIRIQMEAQERLAYAEELRQQGVPEEEIQKQIEKMSQQPVEGGGQ